MPPEILRLPATDLILSGAVRVDQVTSINEKVDLWSLGVTVYELVTGRSPFEGESREAVRAAILAHRQRPLPGFLTPAAADWLGLALAPDAAARPGAKALLRHPWVARLVGPAEAARLAGLVVSMPPMLPGAAVAAAAATAATAGSTSPAGAAAAVAAVVPGLQEMQVAQGPAGAATVAAAAAAATMVGKIAAKEAASSSPKSEGRIPAFVPGPHDASSCSSGAAAPAGSGSGGGGGGATSSSSTCSGGGAPPGLAGSSTGGGSAASVASAPSSPLKGALPARPGAGGPAGPAQQQLQPGGAPSYESAPHNQQQGQQPSPREGNGSKGTKGKHKTKLLTWMCVSGVANSQSQQ
jgi:hypothetical protein